MVAGGRRGGGEGRRGERLITRGRDRGGDAGLTRIAIDGVADLRLVLALRETDIDAIDGDRLVLRQHAGRGGRRQGRGLGRRGVDLDGVAAGAGQVGLGVDEADVGTGGDAREARRAIEDLFGAELGVGGDAVDGRQSIGHFRLIGGLGVRIVDAAVGGIQGQRTHLVEQVVDRAERAVGGLHHRGRLGGVLDGGLQAGDLRLLLL